ncbi:MAG: cytochrome c biogenesis protein CcsA [Clostridia bacterium]|nr:cytochrome c biogenesis protein CcsA [Clostridia bacterium]
MSRLRAALAWLSFALVALALAFAFVLSPAEATMGQVVRLLYVHVGSAWNAMLAFGVVFLASLAYLRARRPVWDRLAAASAEVGVVFTTVTLVSGSFWARAVWNTWWRWEPRLTTTLLLWFVYVAYLLIRESVESPERRGTVAAVVGIVGFADVPVVYLSARLWGGFHPASVELAPPMVTSLLVAVGAFTALYAYLTWLALDLQTLRGLALELRGRAEARGAPAARVRTGDTTA